MRPYADTNFFIRSLLPVPGNAEALALAAESRRRSAERLPVTWLLEIEITTGIEQCIFVTRTSGQFRVTPEATGTAHAFFADDLAQGDFIVSATLDAEALKRAAVELALRHTARHGFRTYDLLHVASAHLLECDAFWSFDAKARALAQAEGLAFNPNLAPLT